MAETGLVERMAEISDKLEKAGDDYVVLTGFSPGMAEHFAYSRADTRFLLDALAAKEAENAELRTAWATGGIIEWQAARVKALEEQVKGMREALEQAERRFVILAADRGSALVSPDVGAKEIRVALSSPQPEDKSKEPEHRRIIQENQAP